MTAPVASRRDRRPARRGARSDRSAPGGGRAHPDESTLVVVTKFFPATDVDLLADLGVTDVGENRDQEAAAKCAELAHRDRLTVHFIGQLQSNKAGSVARYADVVQSVDRAKLVAGARPGAPQAGRRLDVTVQVNLDERAGSWRGGAGRRRGSLADLVAGLGGADAARRHGGRPPGW